ncbi:MAG TPA: hypothetical protein VGD69_19845 [Herpetosiphonaceae bacterium]
MIERYLRSACELWAAALRQCREHLIIRSEIQSDHSVTLEKVWYIDPICHTRVTAFGNDGSPGRCAGGVGIQVKDEYFSGLMLGQTIRNSRLGEQPLYETFTFKPRLNALTLKALEHLHDSRMRGDLLGRSRGCGRHGWKRRFVRGSTRRWLSTRRKSYQHEQEAQTYNVLF